jgi:signal transduction histidine kinase
MNGPADIRATEQKPLALTEAAPVCPPGADAGAGPLIPRHRHSPSLEVGIRGPMNEAQLADVQRIQANQRHLLGLVESVLNYAKIEAGRIEYGLGDVSFSGVLAEVDEIIRPLAEAESVTYRARAFEEGADLTVYADH